MTNASPSDAASAMSPPRANAWRAQPLLQRVLQRQLGGAAFTRATPRLAQMGDAAANEVAVWAQQADAQGPKLVTHDRAGERIDDIVYHPSYRWMQKVAYGGGIVAASYDAALAPEHDGHPKALTFGLGYLFAQAELGLYCPVCMTDGAAKLVQRFGSKSLVEAFVPRLASMDMDRFFTGAMFLTEKAGGSDVGQIRTVAKGSGDTVSLHGEKWFCSNVDADVIMLLARPEGAGPGTRGLGLYLLPRSLPGGGRNRFRIDRIKNKLGVRSMPTGEVTLDGAEAYRLGGAGEGFLQMAEMLNLSRLHNAVASAAAIRRSVDEAFAWAQQRMCFGQPVARLPLMTETLMTLASESRAAVHWVFRLIELLDRSDAGTASTQERALLRVGTPLVKYFLARRSVAMSAEAMEVLGGNGYIEDWPMARVFRDAQVLPIWEGATNVLVLDAFRAVKKEKAGEALIAELRALASTSSVSRLGRCIDALEEAAGALMASDDAEARLRRWTDRASVLWQVAQMSSTRDGGGRAEDLAAAEHLLALHVPEGAGLLGSPVRTWDEVLAVAST